MWAISQNTSVNLDKVTAIAKTSKEDKFYLSFYSAIGTIDFDFPSEDERDGAYSDLMTKLK